MAESELWITCPRCGRTGYNPNDVRDGYSGPVAGARRFGAVRHA